jgi:hypothetical protein
LLALLLSATPAFSAPDLFVEKSRLAPDFLDPGGVTFFTVTTRNQGDAASAAADVRLRIDEGNDGSFEHTLTLPLVALPPHARAVSRWQNAWTPVIGKQPIRALARPRRRERRRNHDQQLHRPGIRPSRRRRSRRAWT